MGGQKEHGEVEAAPGAEAQNGGGAASRQKQRREAQRRAEREEGTSQSQPRPSAFQKPQKTSQSPLSEAKSRQEEE